MAENTKIEWADSTFNPFIGCTKVSPACDNCYAENLMGKRMGVVQWGAGQPRKRTSVKNWNLPLRWDKARFMQCGLCGWRGECDAELIGCGNCGSSDELSDTRRRVFCASLADVFDNEVPVQWRADLFDLIRRCENLDFLLLTKRVGNVMKMANEVADMPRLSSHTGHLIAHQWRNGSPPKNVWLGATVVNQEEADRDIPKLLAVPAAKRFLSMEPLLGPVDLNYVRQRIQAQRSQLARAINGETWLDWVIVGGESGPGARPMSPDWARSIRDQCEEAGVALFVKQMGAVVTSAASCSTCRMICASGRFRHHDPRHRRPSLAALQRVVSRSQARLPIRVGRLPSRPRRRPG